MGSRPDGTEDGAFAGIHRDGSVSQQSISAERNPKTEEHCCPSAGAEGTAISCRDTDYRESSASKQFSAIEAAISAPNPMVIGPHEQSKPDSFF